MQVTGINTFHVCILGMDFTRLCPYVSNMFMYAYLNHVVLLIFMITPMLVICYACWRTPFMHKFMFMTLVLLYITPCVGTT